ncbi:hypothetical protein BJ742DRAFT_777848 [Cladochytrium replicatum]|nr:hypothetical protein BJ742DRAFT_777848 [Cladochytrium replicatum]
MATITRSALTWDELAQRGSSFSVDYVNGPTNPQARMRLFGMSEKDIRVTLYRDNHAWCPYCMKVWAYLEEKQVPYRVEKITMFCYGNKEPWYKALVPSGMLPALKLDDKFITESDDILVALERSFGALHQSISDPTVVQLRRLERLLFRAWCNWLCYPNMSSHQDRMARQKFVDTMQQVENALGATPGPYFLDKFGIVDIIFMPYVERMAASLFYYKGYLMRDPEVHSRFCAWYDAMEKRESYRGMQSDFHTHCHDLPPQMGGCYFNDDAQAKVNSTNVDNGPWDTLPDVRYPEPPTSTIEALHRVVKHHNNIIKVNPSSDKAKVDEALRCALTLMVTGEPCQPPKGSDSVLRYMRDRVNVPRDMSIYAGKRFRKALEETASMVGNGQGEPIKEENRRDQDPALFIGVRSAPVWG